MSPRFKSCSAQLLRDTRVYQVDHDNLLKLSYFLHFFLNFRTRIRFALDVKKYASIIHTHLPTPPLLQTCSWYTTLTLKYLVYDHFILDLVSLKYKSMKYFDIYIQHSFIVVVFNGFKTKDYIILYIQ